MLCVLCIHFPYFLSLLGKFPSERHCVGGRIVDVEQLAGEGEERNVGEVKLLLGQGGHLGRRGDGQSSTHARTHTHTHTHTHLITKVHLSL